MRDAADGVLNQPQYLEAARPPSLRERALDWIVNFFTEVFRSLSTVGGRGVFAWVIVGLFVVAILFLLSRLRTGSAMRKVPTLLPTVDIHRELTAAQWRAEATTHEAAGEWRMGLRCRHRALVAELIDRHTISARPGQTAGEVAQVVSSQVPGAAASMSAATRLFTDVWYGGQPASSTTRDQFEQYSQIVVSSVDAHVAPSDLAEPATV